MMPRTDAMKKKKKYTSFFSINAKVRQQHAIIPTVLEKCEEMEIWKLA